MKLDLNFAHIKNVNVRKQKDGDERIIAVDVKVSAKLNAEQLHEMTGWDASVIDRMFDDNGLSIYPRIGMVAVDKEHEPLSVTIGGAELQYCKANNIRLGLWAKDAIEVIFRIQAVDVRPDVVGVLGQQIDEDVIFKSAAMQTEMTYEQTGT